MGNPGGIPGPSVIEPRKMEITHIYIYILYVCIYIYCIDIVCIYIYMYKQKQLPKAVSNSDSTFLKKSSSMKALNQSKPPWNHKNELEI